MILRFTGPTEPYFSGNGENNKQSRSRTRIIEDEIYATLKEKEKDRKATTITATTATTTTATTTTTKTTTTIKGVVLCNIRKTYHSNSRKWPRKAFFTRIDRVNTRNEAENI